MKRLFNNTAITSVDFLVLIIVNIIATPLLIRYFGVDGYGAFVFLSIFSIYGAMLFFDLGMQDALINHVARFEAAGDRGRLHDSLTVTIAYYGALGVLLCCGLHFAREAIASHLVRGDSKVPVSDVTMAINVIAVNLFLQFLTIPFTAVLEGLRRYVVTKSLNAGMNILRYSLVVVVALLTGSLTWAFTAITLLTFVRLIILVFIFLKKLPHFSSFRLHIDTRLFKTLFNYSSILFVTRIVGLLWVQTDKVLIMLYLVVSNMTVYDVVSRPAMMIRVVVGILIAAIIPEVARLHHANDIDGIRKLHVNLLRYAYFAILPVVGVLAINMDSVLRLWVGKELASNYALALIVLASHLILPCRVIPATVMVGIEKVKQTLWIPVGAAFVNVVLSLLLVSQVGLIGLLAARFVAECCAAIPYMLVMRKYLGMTRMEFFRPLSSVLLVTLGAGLLQGGARVLFDTSIIPLTICAVLTLLAEYWIVYEYLLDESERRFVKERLMQLHMKLRRRHSGESEVREEQHAPEGLGL